MLEIGNIKILTYGREMYDYFVRITHPYEVLVRLVSAWALECSSLAVFEHVGSQTEKVHCHLVILGSRLQKKQLRNIGSQFAVLKGNEYCSFKECVSWEIPLTYMTKGELSAKYLKTFTIEQIDSARARWTPRQSYKKPPTKSEAAWADFQEWVILEREISRCEPDEIIVINGEATRTHKKFDIVKKHAHQYAGTEFQGMWSRATWDMYKMLVYSYCFQNNISIPDSGYWAKWN